MSLTGTGHINAGIPENESGDANPTSERRQPMGSWKCGNCGYELQADAPPEKCPSCKEKCDFLDNTCYTPDCQYDGKDPRIK